MALLLYYVATPFSLPRYRPLRTSIRQCCSSVSASLDLPFTEKKAKYYQQLQVALDVVERACNLCIDVQRSLFYSDEKVIQKMDRTPVTIADFGVQALEEKESFTVMKKSSNRWTEHVTIADSGVQALVSRIRGKKKVGLSVFVSVRMFVPFEIRGDNASELSKTFPLIPLVAEEDSGFVRKNNLADAIVEVVRENLTISHQELSQDEVLKAIDRGGKEAFLFGPEPATYWILDPIDGTRGFVNGGGALYVVGLSLIVEKEIVLGVMGCPNWQDSYSDILNNEVGAEENSVSRSGIIMITHVGCGTWTSRLSNMQQLANKWTRCSVDEFQNVHEARLCIPESQTWESLPLSKHFSATTDPDIAGKKEILLLPTCCGSLCKYLMVATGRASVFINRAKATTIIKVWDHAVGVLCIHEAGGKVSDWKGCPLDFAADEMGRRALLPSGGVLVTNNNLHSQILEMMYDT